MRKVLIGFLALGLCVLGFGALWMVRADDDDTVKFAARLSGFQEVGSLGALETGALLSAGKGTLELTLNKAAERLDYTLTYSFPSATSVLQSHIHFGKDHVPGGIMVFFCTNLGNGPAGVSIPACPTFAGTVTGTITPSAVLALPGQNVPTAGNFDALVAALTSDTAYVNIHTTAFKGGEIRGQIHLERRRRDRDRKKGEQHEAE